ncbi:MAG: TraR/DksA family transcriptional regulator [Nocardioidaceae bacterium]|nr:TraR/DksA family transcriptional regulator [Nocardioidaceae bacterium]
MADDPRAALDELARRTTERLAALTGDYSDIVAASQDSNADDEHDPEGSTIAFERSQVGALVEAAREQLVEVEAARQRLDDGTYGACERCGRPIGDERLTARPTARLCIDCARVSPG